MWWLETRTTQARPIIWRQFLPTDSQPIGQPEFHGGVSESVKTRLLKRQPTLLDHLTPEQHAANRVLSEVDCGHQAEIDRLRHDVESLEKSLREKSTQIQSLTVQLGQVEAERDRTAKESNTKKESFELQAKRFRDFVVGYEKHLERCDAEFTESEKLRIAASQNATDQIVVAKREVQSELRRHRGQAQAAEMLAAARADQVRRLKTQTQEQATQAESRHLAQIAGLQLKADADRARLSREMTLLQQENEQLTQALVSAERQFVESDSARKQIERQHQIELSRFNIEASVLKARIESSESNRKSLECQLDELLHRFENTEELLKCWEREAYRFRSAATQGTRQLLRLQESSAKQSESDSLEIESLVRSLFEREEHLLHLSAESDNAHDELLAASEQFERLRSTLENCRAELAQVSRGHQASLNEIEQKSIENRQLLEVIDAKQIQFDTMAIELASTRQDLAIARAESESVTAQLHQHASTIEQMRESESRLIETQHSQSRSFRDQIEALQSTVDELVASLDHERNQQMMNEETHRSESLSHAQQMTIANEQLKQLNEEVCVLRQRGESQQVEIEKLLRTADEVSAVYAESAKLKAQLSAGKARGELLIETYRERIKKAQETIKRYHLELESLRQQLPRRAA